MSVETIGNRIKKARKAKGLSQNELGKLLGVSQAMIAQYEKDFRNPKIETLEKIADVLDVPVEYLKGWTDQGGGFYGKEAPPEMQQQFLDRIKNRPETIAAHFSGDEYTKEELEEIRQFAEFVKSKRKNTPNFSANAAHARTDIEITPEERAADEDMLDD